MQKALPNRQPESAAAKHANRMMTHGGAPLPVKTIQQVSGVFCPSCGEHHRPGKTCGVKAIGVDPILLALEESTKDAFFKALRSRANAAGDPLLGFFDDYVSKGRPGNPYPHQKNGWFGRKPAESGGGGGDSGMAHLTGSDKKTNPGGRMAPTISGVGGAPKTPAPAAAASDIGTANTMQAPAPAARAAKPTTTPGVGPQANRQEEKTGVGIPAARAAANQANRVGLVDKMEAQHAGTIAEVQEPRLAGEAAYNKHRSAALAAGKTEDEAHEIGKQHGSEAWDNALAARAARKQAAPTPGTPMAPKTDQADRADYVKDLESNPGPRMRQRAQGIPGYRGQATAVGHAPANVTQEVTSAGGPQTNPGTPTTPGMGPASPAPASRPTSIALSPPGATGQFPVVHGGQPQQAASAPTASAPTATPPGVKPPDTPGEKPPGAKPGAAGKQSGGINPWSMYGVGSGVGAGMFTPGGTVNPTAGGAVNAAHSLLHGSNTQRPPAAVDRAQKLSQAAKPAKAPKVKGGGQSSMQVSP